MATRKLAGGSEILMDSQALARLVRSPQGPIFRDVTARSERVQGGAIKQVGKARPRLMHTIVKRPVVDDRGPANLVGSAENIARLHHDGTKPHVIFPKKGTVLAFPASKGSGAMVFARSVNHPGTQPNRYLTDNLQLAR